jgi:hypothetical protein
MSYRDDQQPVFQLTLRALPDAVPPIVRLRRLLKLLLGSFGLVCTEAVELPAASRGVAQASGSAASASDGRRRPTTPPAGPGAVRRPTARETGRAGPPGCASTRRARSRVLPVASAPRRWPLEKSHRDTHLLAFVKRDQAGGWSIAKRGRMMEQAPTEAG